MTFVVKPDEIEAWELHEGSKIKMIMNGRNMTTIISDWAPRSSFPLHTHPHEQMGLCLQGEAVFTIDGKEYVVGKGEVYTIPPNVQHMQRNDGDVPAIFLECFAPVREDLVRGRFEQKIGD